MTQEDVKNFLYGEFGENFYKRDRARCNELIRLQDELEAVLGEDDKKKLKDLLELESDDHFIEEMALLDFIFDFLSAIFSK